MAHRGWLRKRAERLGKAKKRWFVLYGGSLHYFKRSTAVQAFLRNSGYGALDACLKKGSSREELTYIKTIGVSAIRDIILGRGKDGDWDGTYLGLVTASRTFHLNAPDEHEALGWKEALEEEKRAGVARTGSTSDFGPVGADGDHGDGDDVSEAGEEEGEDVLHIVEGVEHDKGEKEDEERGREMTRDDKNTVEVPSPRAESPVLPLQSETARAGARNSEVLADDSCAGAIGHSTEQEVHEGDKLREGLVDSGPGDGIVPRGSIVGLRKWAGLHFVALPDDPVDLSVMQLRMESVGAVVANVLAWAQYTWYRHVKCTSGQPVSVGTLVVGVHEADDVGVVMFLQFANEYARFFGRSMCPRLSNVLRDGVVAGWGKLSGFLSSLADGADAARAKKAEDDDVHLEELAIDQSLSRLWDMLCDLNTPVVNRLCVLKRSGRFTNEDGPSSAHVEKFGDDGKMKDDAHGVEPFVYLVRERDLEYVSCRHKLLEENSHLTSLSQLEMFTQSIQCILDIEDGVLSSHLLSCGALPQCIVARWSTHADVIRGACRMRLWLCWCLNRSCLSSMTRLIFMSPLGRENISKFYNGDFFPFEQEDVVLHVALLYQLEQSILTFSLGIPGLKPVDVIGLAGGDIGKVSGLVGNTVDEKQRRTSAQMSRDDLCLVLSLYGFDQEQLQDCTADELRLLIGRQTQAGG